MNIKSLIKSFSSSRWDIGIITTPISDILQGKKIQVSWIKHTFHNSWFADPFIIDETAHSFEILVEEFYKPICRGRISKLTVDKSTMSVIKKDVVLEIASHLSFPAYFRRDNNIYIYPENAQSGKLTLYKYDKNANICKEVGVLCDAPLSDAVLTDAFGDDYLFATSFPNPNGRYLEIYGKNNNGFQLLEKISFNDNVARMAGLFFKYKDEVYRPTQECNIQYGHAITLQKVKKNKNGFSFSEIRRIYSTHPKFKVGTHTFNLYRDGVIATDALTFDNMWLRKILMAFHILPKR